MGKAMHSCLRALVPLALLSGFVTACEGCGKDKPYTPFHAPSTLASSSAAAPSAVAEEPDAAAPTPKFVVRVALPAPAGAVRWSLDGREITAPEGRVLERGLSADFDSDGKREVVAWTVPKPGAPPAAPGELWLYPAEGAPKRLFQLPGFVPTGPACTHAAALLQTGSKSVTLDVSASCTTALLPRAPARSVSVIVPLSNRPELVTLRVAPPAPNDPFSVDVDSTDRDSDGRDDARVTFTQKPPCLRGAGTECSVDKADRSVAAQVIWLDRAAGVSRDATEPAASIGLLAQAEVGRSKRKPGARDVPRNVAQIRRLMSTLCAEGATARIFDADGGPIHCAPLAVLLDRLVTAEVQAALTDKEPTRALGALERDGWYFGKLSDKRRAELVKSVLAEATTLDAKERLLKLEVAPAPAAPRLSPLAFEPSGALLVQTPKGLFRVASGGEPEALDADAGVASWPLEPATKGGRKLTSLLAPCDRSDVHMLLAGPGGESAPGSRLLSPRPGACAGGKSPGLTAVVLGEKDDLPSLLVALEPIGTPLSSGEVRLRPRVHGSPSSPDGRYAAYATREGLWLEGGDKPELWRLPAGAAPRECTASDGGREIACTQGSSVRVYGR